MTRYSVDPARHELAATWGTGEGDLSTRIATAPASTDTAALLRLARALTLLSTTAWRTYTHPASATGSLEPGSEGWRREEERRAFAEIAQVLEAPHLPECGTITEEYSPLLESAHRVGRALLAVEDPTLAEAVRAEAAAELAAVESAELGDLTGRAQQAVLLSREGASPVQVAAADRLFEQDPLGPASLFTDVDPTAAAVAAAHWLAAAAEVAAAVSGYPPTEVVQVADDIEALPHETPTLVLQLLQAGVSPYDAVTHLVRDALHVADGLLPDLGTFRKRLDEVEELIAKYGAHDPTLGPALTAEIRLTPLDPQRPAIDLLEDLVAGIHGCWLIHDEHTDTTGDEHEPADDDDDEEWDDETAERRHQQSQDDFAELVRETAALHRDRLI